MKTFFLLILLTTIVLAAPALGQGVPSAGSFGLGISMNGIVTEAGSIASINNELGASYWVTGNITLVGGFGFTSVSAGGTTTIFSFAPGILYHLNKQQLSPVIGGAFVVSVTSPSVGNSVTTFGFLVGGGAEYYFSKHFGVMVVEGFQFSTTSTTPSMTTIGFASRLGLNWYF
jgi:hypothetical protein